MAGGRTLVGGGCTGFPDAPGGLTAKNDAGAGMVGICMHCYSTKLNRTLGEPPTLTYAPVPLSTNDAQECKLGISQTSPLRYHGPCTVRHCDRRGFSSPQTQGPANVLSRADRCTVLAPPSPRLTGLTQGASTTARKTQGSRFPSYRTPSRRACGNRDAHETPKQGYSTNLFKERMCEHRVRGGPRGSCHRSRHQNGAMPSTNHSGPLRIVSNPFLLQDVGGRERQRTRQSSLATAAGR